MRYLQADDLPHLARGAAILGSGGGGDPCYDLLLAQHRIETFGAISLLDVEELEDSDLIIPIAMMGAPLIGMEKLLSGKEFDALIQAVQKKWGPRRYVLMPAEIGGSNAFVPLCVAAAWNLPVLDADGIGRAFPELPMCVFHLHGVSPTPAFVADSLGCCVEIAEGDAAHLELCARKLTVSFGSSAAIVCYPMPASIAKKTVVKGSISQAILLGKTWFASSKKNILAKGVISEIQQEVRAGFLEGWVRLDSGCTIFYRNEYLLAKKAGEIIAATPDILVLLEEESGTPITSESLQYGLRVSFLSLPAPEIWRSEPGMKLVGQEALCSQWV